MKFSHKTFSSPFFSYKLLFFTLLPSFIFYLLFFLYPFVYNILLSFTNHSLYKYYNYDFIGLDNYIKVLNEDEFYVILVRTIVFAGFNVFLQVLLGISFALLFTSKSLHGSRIFRSLMLVPWAIPVYIAILVWRSMFLTEFGVINAGLRSWGFDAIPWLSDPLYAMLVINIIQLWLAYPFMMTVCMSALQSIPDDLYESATLDGASFLQKFRYITFPLIIPIISLAIIMTTNTTFQLFIIPWFLTRGGPMGQTDLVMSWGYKQAFISQRYGFQAAYMIIISLLILAITIVIIKKARLLE